ncbi:hypothetical protein [Mycolicibacter minnesotensis]
MRDVITRGSITAAVVAVAVVVAAAVGYQVGDRRTSQPTVVESVLPAVPSTDEYLPEPILPDRYTQVEHPAEDLLTPRRPAARGQLRAELERLRDDIAAIRDLQQQLDVGSEYR